MALIDIVKRSGTTLEAIASQAMTSLPQVLVNVRVGERVPDVAIRLGDEIAAVEAELGATGRVLVRASGTEPLIRAIVGIDFHATGVVEAESGIRHRIPHTEVTQGRAYGPNQQRLATARHHETDGQILSSGERRANGQVW